MWEFGIGIDDITLDDIICEDIHPASMNGMDDITCDDLTYDDRNPDVFEILVLGLTI